MGSPLKSLGHHGFDLRSSFGSDADRAIREGPDQMDFAERSFLPLIRILSWINAIIRAWLCLCQNSAKSITTPSRTHDAGINQNIMRFGKFGLGNSQCEMIVAAHSLEARRACHLILLIALALDLLICWNWAFDLTFTLAHGSLTDGQAVHALIQFFVQTQCRHW